MKIKGNESAQTILKEIGLRIKQYRISLNITQADLAEKCGISSSTEVRIEKGEDSQFSNYIKILYAFNMLENLDLLVPEAQPDFKSLYEEKPMRQRAKALRKNKNAVWTWGEDR